MAVVGGVIGMIVAVAVGRLAQSILFELQGHDPMVLTLSTIVLGIVALGAGFIPALRASKIDPMNALRYE
jgi:ABC-type antimicrobial peptide transport system permease subunit